MKCKGFYLRLFKRVKERTGDIFFNNMLRSLGKGETDGEENNVAKGMCTCIAWRCCVFFSCAKERIGDEEVNNMLRSLRKGETGGEKTKLQKECVIV